MVEIAYLRCTPEFDRYRGYGVTSTRFWVSLRPDKPRCGIEQWREDYCPLDNAFIEDVYEDDERIPLEERKRIIPDVRAVQAYLESESVQGLLDRACGGDYEAFCEVVRGIKSLKHNEWSIYHDPDDWYRGLMDDVITGGESDDDIKEMAYEERTSLPAYTLVDGIEEYLFEIRDRKRSSHDDD